MFCPPFYYNETTIKVVEKTVMKKNRSFLVEAVICGFAMFAVFFGAGNLIFPPFLGLEAGTDWFKGFLCFVMADAGLAIMTVLACVRFSGRIEDLLAPLGRIPTRILLTIIILCVGPLVAIPRTCATTFELGIKQLLPGFSSWIFALIFFGIVALLTLKPTAVVDIIGKFLTPVLLITLAVLCIKGVLSPVGEISETAKSVNVSKDGILAGYQTMDALGAIPISIIILKSLKDKGFTGQKKIFRVMTPGSIVAFAGLFLVYGGLCYLGATTSLMELGDINQTGLVVLVTELLLKKFGVVLLGMIVLFACLTTAIGLTSSAAEYFNILFKNKVSYRMLVFVICAIGILVSNFGISMIISLASPLLTVVYPVFLTQVVLSFFNKQLHNPNINRGAAIGALIVSLLDTVRDLGVSMPFLARLPLAEYGFAWVLPAVLGALIGAMIRPKPGRVRVAELKKPEMTPTEMKPAS